jgi:hypothetical protein
MHSYPAHFAPEHVGSVFIRNIGNTAHFLTVLTPPPPLPVRIITNRTSVKPRNIMCLWHYLIWHVTVSELRDGRPRSGTRSMQEQDIVVK